MLCEEILEQAEAECADQGLLAAGIDGDEDGGGEDEVGGGLAPAQISCQRHLHGDDQVGEDEIADPAHTFGARYNSAGGFSRYLGLFVLVCYGGDAGLRLLWLCLRLGLGGLLAGD